MAYWDPVGVGLGVALVPASTALLGIKGVRLWPLRRSSHSEILALLQRKNDSRPVLSTLDDAVGLIFKLLRLRVARLIGTEAARQRGLSPCGCENERMLSGRPNVASGSGA